MRPGQRRAQLREYQILAGGQENSQGEKSAQSDVFYEKLRLLLEMRKKWQEEIDGAVGSDNQES